MDPTAANLRDTDDLRVVLAGDDESVRAFLHLFIHPADLLEVLAAADLKEWPRLLRLIEDEDKRADVVAQLDDGDREALLPLLPHAEIGALLKEMDSDDAADVLQDLEPADQEGALNHLPKGDREQVQTLLAYPEDSAGGIMQLERAQVHRDAVLADATQVVRDLVEDDVEVLTVWVVDEADRLVGELPIVDLLLQKSTTRVAEIMEPVVAQETPGVDQEVVARLFSKYDLVSLPVVDEAGVLLGRIVIDDIVDVLTEEAEEDALIMGGTSAEELLYRNKVLPIARVRLPWLAINLAGSIVSAFLLHTFEPVMEKAIIIASFVPVITAMGGNVGIQSATILMRGLSTGRVGLPDVPRIIFKEMRVGLLMGLVCGSVVGVVASFLFGATSYHLGLVVFVAMVSAMTVAATMGAVAPAGLKVLGVDPAIASGPFVTTANDITGILIYMGTAIFFLDQLASG
jgi:magnesium transporter